MFLATNVRQEIDGDNEVIR